MGDSWGGEEREKEGRKKIRRKGVKEEVREKERKGNRFSNAHFTGYICTLPHKGKEALVLCILIGLLKIPHIGLFFIIYIYFNIFIGV